MRHALWPVALALCLPAAGAAQGPGATRDEAAVTALMHEWIAALKQQDTAALRRIIAADFRVTTSDGHFLTREEDLSPITGGDLSFESASADSLHVRVFGRTAIVTGVAGFGVVYRGRRSAVRERFTEIFLKRRGRWQVVASQSTRLPSRDVPSAHVSTATVRAAIDDGNAQYIRAFGAGDAAGVAAVYAPDGSRFERNGVVLRGRDAIRADLTQFIERVGPVIVTIETSDFWVVNELAYETGRWSYTFTPPGQGRQRVGGRYVTIWRQQQDGGWRIFADIGLAEQS
jgi:uncharacterized protein (TIGR02246 family)